MRCRGVVFLLALIASPLAAGAAPVTISTGDLGDNVVYGAGLFQAMLPASTPSTTLPASIDVTYGLWNDPHVNVFVRFNGAPVGSFWADLGYTVPGPRFVSLDVTGLLVDGVNTIAFDGAGTAGDYVIGQVDLNYDDRPGTLPEPGAGVLIALGAAIAAVRRRRPLD